jgi:biotin carboxylase
MREAHTNVRCVLLLGWEPEYAEVLNKYGMQTIIVANRNDLAKLMSSSVRVAAIVRPVSDPSNVEDVFMALEVGGLLGRITDIHTNMEFAQTTASIIGEHLSIPHVPLSTVLGARDKRIQKARVRSAGIPVADVTDIGRIWRLNGNAVAAAKYPAVLKPAAGSGGFMTRLVRDADEVKASLAAYAALGGDSPAFILESAILASESVVNGLVRDGKIVHLSFVRYSQPVMSGDVTPERTCVAIDPSDESLYERAQVFSDGVVDALCLENTVFHMECFERGDELIFSEVASRAPGCGMTPLTKAKFGLEFAKEGLLASLGLPSDGNWKTSPSQMATLDFPGAPGVIIRVPTTAELLRQAGVVDGSMAVRPGDMMRDMRTHSSWQVGTAVVEGADQEQLLERVARIYSWIRDSVVSLPAPGVRPS